MNNITKHPITKFIEVCTMIASGRKLYCALYGKKVSRMMRGKAVTYFIQPVTYREIRSKVFEPISKRFPVSWNSVKLVPRRAPIASVIFVTTTFLLIHGCFSR